MSLSSAVLMQHTFSLLLLLLFPPLGPVGYPFSRAFPSPALHLPYLSLNSFALWYHCNCPRSPCVAAITSLPGIRPRIDATPFSRFSSFSLQDHEEPALAPLPFSLFSVFLSVSRLIHGIRRCGLEARFSIRQLCRQRGRLSSSSSSSSSSFAPPRRERRERSRGGLALSMASVSPVDLLLPVYRIDADQSTAGSWPPRRPP